VKQSLNFVYVRTVDICSSYLDIVLSNGVKPFVVFDGLLLPAKEKGITVNARLNESI
jgi:hypothetical protein